MFSLKVDVKNVSTFLTYYLGDIENCLKSKQIKIPQIFVTDYTWVNIHPILNVFLKTNIRKYLEQKFRDFSTDCLSNDSVILIDKLHFIKFLLQNARRIAKKNVVAETFVCSVLQLCQCKVKQDILTIFSAIVRLFCSDVKLREDEKVIETCYDGYKKFCEETESIGEIENMEDFMYSESSKTLKKESPFYIFFNNLKSKALDELLDREDFGTNHHPLFFTNFCLIFCYQRNSDLFYFKCCCSQLNCS